MTEKEGFLRDIVEAIFKLPSPKIQRVRQESIFEFIKTTVNEDCVSECIVVDMVLNDKPVVYVYLLTSTRFIQIGIDAGKQIHSIAFALRNIINVERKLVDEDKMAVQIVFKDNIVGINYSAKNSKITKFFQKVEQIWASRR